MAKIKLNAASGGGSVALEGPASLGSDKVIKFPNSPNVIIQVLQTAKTDTFSTSSAGFSDITGLSVAITPTSSNSKILVQYDAFVARYNLKKGGRAGYQQKYGYGSNDHHTGVGSASCNHLDSPSTTSATTYKLQVYRHGGTIRVNTPFNDTDASYTGRGISTITVMEVSV